MTQTHRLLVYEALDHLRVGDIRTARLKLGIRNSVKDDEFVEGIVSLKKGLELFKQGRQPQAREYLQKAMPVINGSVDEEAKIVLGLTSNISEGISKLMSGDAHGALPLFEFANEVVERMSFFTPDLRKMAFSSKAMVYVSLARASLNAADMITAEIWVGKAYDQHEQLLALLDPKQTSDLPAFVEVYGSRLETAIAYGRLDLEALDVDSLATRLAAVRGDFSRLEEFIKDISPGPMLNIAKVLLILYSVLMDLHVLERDIVFNRLPVNRNRIERFQSTAKQLFQAEEIAKKTAERGKLFLYTISYLKRIRENLLKAGKIGKEDFGRSAGLISFFCFLALIIVIHLLIRPSGASGLAYSLGALMIALIAGFGYGALRFKPLLKLYAETVKPKGEKDG